MPKAEEVLREYLRKVKRDISGVSWREKSRCLAEIESAIRDQASEIAEDMDEDEALKKSIESMGNPLDVAKGYSITVFEGPTLKTYLLLSLNTAAASVLIMIGLGPSFFSWGYDPIHWQNPSFLEVLGIIVVVLGVPSLILFLIQIFISRLIPSLRTYVLLPYVISLLFGAILIFVIIGDNIVEVMLDPRSFFHHEDGWEISYMLFLGVIAFVPVAAVLLLWFYVDTSKYDLFVSGKKVRRRDYVRAVMAKLSSLDIVTRRCIRKELERDIDERLKDAGQSEPDQEVLYTELGSPNEMALMLLESHKPQQGERLRKLASFPLAILTGVSLVVAIVFSIAVLNLVTDPNVTFGLFALLLSFPLLIISVVQWTLLSRMVVNASKKKDLLVPTTVLAVATLLILTSGLGVTLADEQLSKSTPYSHSFPLTSYQHEGGDLTIFWIEHKHVPHESEPNRRRCVYVLYLTNINSDGEVVHRQEIMDMSTGPGHDQPVYMTASGDFILILTDNPRTHVLKVSKSGTLLDDLLLDVPTETSRFSGGGNETLFISGMRHGEWERMEFATVRTSPNLELVNNWEKIFRSNEIARYSLDRLLIRNHDVQAMLTTYLNGENHSFVDSKSLSFDFTGNLIDEILLYSDNITREHETDYGNSTFAVVENAVHIENDKTMAFIKTGQILDNNATYTIKAITFDSDNGITSNTELYNYTKYGRCGIYYGPYEVVMGPESSDGQRRIYITYASLNTDFNNDPETCYEGYQYNTTGSGMYLAIFDWGGTFDSQSFLGPPTYVAHGWFKLTMLEYGGNLIISWGGDVGRFPCGTYICEAALYQTQFDANGQVIQERSYETSNTNEMFLLFSFEPLKIENGEILGVGYGIQKFEVTAPDIQLKGRNPEMEFMYFGELDTSVEPRDEIQIDYPQVFPDEILQIAVAIVSTSLAIVVLLVSNYVFRRRKYSSTSPGAKRGS